MAKTSGASQLLEKLVSALAMLGYEKISYKDFQQSDKKGKYLIPNYPYQNIYGGNGRYEWGISHPSKGTAVVECKYQNGSGSVDEKLPYVYENFLAGNVDHMIFIYAGDFWEKSKRGQGGLRWLKNKSRALTNKSIHIKSTEGFVGFATKFLK